MDSHRSIQQDHHFRPDLSKKRPSIEAKSTIAPNKNNSMAAIRALHDVHLCTVDDILYLQKVAGNQAVNGSSIQAKLIVGAAGDAYEQQADQVAEQITQHSQTSQSAGQTSGRAPLPEIIGESSPGLPTLNKGFAAGEKVERAIQSQRGRGRPLPTELRQEMETKMGADFSAVRLHMNNEATQLNQHLAARAFTHGKDIYLDGSRHNPFSQEGKRLLAHELTHVLQQTGKQFVNNAGNVASRPSSAGIVQRDPDDDKLKAAEPASSSHYGEFIPTDVEPVKPGVSPAVAALRDRKSDLAIKLAKAAKQPHPAPLKLPEKYKDEDKKLGWRAPKGDPRAEWPDWVTHYYSDAERERNKLTPTTSTAPILRREGRPMPGPLSGPETKKTLYAMSPSGQAVLGSGPDRSFGADLPGPRRLPPRLSPGPTRQQRQDLHHSSIFAGGDVAHAGHIAADAGKVTYMDDDSGHYRPDAVHTWDAFNRFKEQGQLSEKGYVSMVNKGLEKTQAAYGSDRLNLPFSAYEQTGGNEEQARNKRSMMQQLLEKTAQKRADVDKGAIKLDKASLMTFLAMHRPDSDKPLFRDDNTADKGYNYE